MADEKIIIETEPVETETEVVEKDNVFKKVGKKVKSGVTNWLDRPGKTNREKLKTLGTIGAVAGATVLAFLVGKEVQKQENDNLLLTDEANSDDYDTETAEIETETAEIETEPVDEDFDVEVEEF